MRGACGRHGAPPRTAPLTPAPPSRNPPAPRGIGLSSPIPRSPPRPAALPVTFTAPILKSPAKGDWTYLIWPDSAAVFATAPASKIAGTVDAHPLRTAFMPLGAGHHKLPLTAKTHAAIGNSVGDTVTVVVEQRLE